MSDENPMTDRRTVLKAAGGTLLSAGVASAPAVASGSRRGPSLDEVYARARALRERTGDHELFVDYLVNRGYRMARRGETFTLPHPDAGTDEVSTQKIDKSEISTDMTLTHGCDSDYMYVDYHITVDASSLAGAVGDGGPDEITLAWNDDHFRTVDYRWYCDADNGYISSTTLNGLNWRWEDGKSCYYGCNVTFNCGGKLKKLQTSQERAVRGTYHHTWKNVEYQGFGVSSSGSVVWSFEPSQNTWEGKYETREESDAITDSSRCN